VPQRGQLAEVTMSTAACTTGTITAQGTPPGLLPLAFDPIVLPFTSYDRTFAVPTGAFLIENTLSGFAFENK
jgi:hypothetical protein